MTKPWPRAIFLTSGVLLCAIACSAPQARAATPRFDGLWSVLVITDSGTCDRGYRYAVRVEDGKVRYDGEADIDLSGQISRNGQLRVSIRRGEQEASGTGRLSGDIGSGQWQGSSSTGECRGRWQAERRAAN